MLDVGKMISIGKISGPVGLRGELKLFIAESYEHFIIQNFKTLKFYLENNQPFPMHFKRKQGKFIICQVDNINDRNESEKLGKPKIFCIKEELPKLDDNEFYSSDLMGLDIYENKIHIGKVANIFNYGAGDIVEIKMNDGSEALYPFTKEIFEEIFANYINVKIPKFL